ncbi:hypothetical protein OCU04_006338 [Sclerotinia nivalis]|uniref:Uncharacterized protein n=1 Tax=Sclerotinia nivalis TaxID=352851 RepID=A0A9X0AMU2_9HELO|nr:hypothetical protein OCU04_006338 [Sclerotinia nivalis]
MQRRNGEFMIARAGQHWCLRLKEGYGLGWAGYEGPFYTTGAHAEISTTLNSRAERQQQIYQFHKVLSRRIKLCTVTAFCGRFWGENDGAWSQRLCKTNFFSIDYRTHFIHTACHECGMRTCIYPSTQ